MSLRELDGHDKHLTELPHRQDFDRVWNRIAPDDQRAIEAEINRRLDELASSSEAITNISIEGGQRSDVTGLPGDWTGTVLQPIFDACGGSQEQAGMFFGNLWKEMIIDHHGEWIGIRQNPTFPKRGVTLGGKTYFIPGK